MPLDYKKFLIIEDSPKYEMGSVKNVYYMKSDKHVGDFVMDVDGFYRFFPSDEKGGSYSQHHLEILYLALEDLNREWEEIINQYTVVGH